MVAAVGHPDRPIPSTRLLGSLARATANVNAGHDETVIPPLVRPEAKRMITRIDVLRCLT